MDRQAFNACISEGLKGKHFTKEERKMEFCILAKKCAKNLPRDEAERICSQPKPEKPAKEHRRGRKHEAAVECNSTMFIPACEKKLAGMVKSGELPSTIDVPGICYLILG